MSYKQTEAPEVTSAQTPHQAKSAGEGGAPSPIPWGDAATPMPLQPAQRHPELMRMPQFQRHNGSTRWTFAGHQAFASPCLPNMMCLLFTWLDNQTFALHPLVCLMCFATHRASLCRARLFSLCTHGPPPEHVANLNNTNSHRWQPGPFPPGTFSIDPDG